MGGEVLGRYGVGIDEVTPRVGDADPNFKPLADFSFGYQPINGNYPTASPGSYTVQAGDTLGSIARGAYGDAQLWWRVAEANGLSGNSDLRVGQTLSIPNKVGTVHNGADSFKPYDPSKITGDTTPNMPAPNNGNDCGGLGAILVVIVIVVVAVVTQQYYLANYATAVGTTAAGATVTTTGVAASSAVAAGTASYTAGSLIAAGAIGGAAGAVAGQIVGNATGLYDGFDWKAVALGAIGGAVAGGIAGSGVVNTSNAVANVAVRAAVGNAASQGIAVATGLQSSFSWRGVAAAAAGGAAGALVGEALGSMGSGGGDVQAAQGMWNNVQAVARSSLQGFAAGLTTAAMRGGRVNVAQVAVDAFGNALGGALADAATSGSPNQSDAESARLNRYENNAIQSTAPDQSAAESARLDRYESAARDQEWIAQDDAIMVRRADEIADAGVIDLDGGRMRLPDGRVLRSSVSASNLTAVDSSDPTASTGDRRRVLFSNPNGPIYSSETGMAFDGLARNTRYPVPGPSWLKQTDGSPLTYTFDSTGQPFWRAGDTVMAIPAPYAQPTLAGLQTSALGSGALDALLGLPSAVATGASDLVHGRVTMNSFLNGLYENSPVGVLGAMSDGDYYAAGGRGVGTGFGLATGAAIEYGAVPMAGRALSQARSYVNGLAPDVSLSPFAPELSLGSPNLVGVPFVRSANPLSPVLEFDALGNEVVYRTMSPAQFEQLKATDRLPPTGETSTAASLDYSSSNYRGVTVRLTTAPGTSAQLQEIGIVAPGKATAAQFPGMPTEAEFGPWGQTNARFKVEGGQTTTQLGQGRALDIFNQNLIKFELVPKVGP